MPSFSSFKNLNIDISIAFDPYCQKCKIDRQYVNEKWECLCTDPLGVLARTGEQPTQRQKEREPKP